MPIIEINGDVLAVSLRTKQSSYSSLPRAGFPWPALLPHCMAPLPGWTVLSNPPLLLFRPQQNPLSRNACSLP